MMARRAAQEILAGDAVAIGSGLPSSIPHVVPAGSGVWLVSENGAVGYSPASSGTADESASVPGAAVVGVSDLAAMVAGGNLGLAILEAAQVSAAGDLVHWTTAETPVSQHRASPSTWHPAHAGSLP